VLTVSPQAGPGSRLRTGAGPAASRGGGRTTIVGMARKDELGRAGEERAAAYLTHEGYTVLARNWRGRGGELDVVACRGRDLVAVEVKTRRGEGFGHPLEAIDARKLRRVWRLALQWAAAHPEHARGRALRVDAIAVLGPDARAAAIEHLEDLR